MQKLALHGPFKAGKSYLAKALEDRGWQVLNYTDFIKGKLCEALAAVGMQVTVEQMHANKEFYRPLIIEFATVIGCDQGYGVEDLIAQIKPDAEGVVFDNVRFPAQWNLLETAGLTLLRLTTPDRVRLARARGVGMTKERFLAMAIEEPTEQPLPEQPGEIRLSVNGDIEKVLNELTAALLKQAAV